MRPGFRFTADAGWINDPHGISHRAGRYHLFLQYVPRRTTWSIGCHRERGAYTSVLAFVVEDILDILRERYGIIEAVDMMIEAATSYHVRALERLSPQAN